MNDQGLPVLLASVRGGEQGVHSESAGSRATRYSLESEWLGPVGNVCSPK